MKEETDRAERNHMHTVSACIFTVFMLGIFPLVCHDGYFDIQTWKAQTMRCAALAYLAAELILIMMGRRFAAGGDGSPGIVRKLPDRRPAWHQCFLLLFLCGIVFSTLLSQWPLYACSGDMGRNVGTIDYLLCGAFFLVLESRFHFREHLEEVIAILNAAAFVLIILNFWGMDPLGMYRELIPEQHDTFIGTLGNINTAAAFICMAAPAWMVRFVLCRSRRRRMVYGFLAVLGFYCGFASSSDSFLLGCAGAFLVLLLYVIHTGKSVRIFSRCACLFLAGAVLMDLTLALADRLPFSSAFLKQYGKKDLLGRVLGIHSIIGIMCVIAVLELLPVFSGYAGGRFQHFPNRLKNMLPGLVLAVLIAAAAMLFFVNLFREAADTPWGRWLDVFIVPDSFGTDRGYVWRRSLEMWRSYSFPEKMFGCGTDCFYLKMQPVYGKEMADLFGAPFADAHCTFLQMLMTVGVVGTAGYFGFLISMLIAFWKRIKKCPELLTGAAVLGACLMEGLVNAQTSVCEPVLFVILGCSMAIYNLSAEI